jgi:hypothetical protein
MGKPEVTIRLDQGDDATFIAGDTIAGTVHVAADERDRVRKLTVSLRWKTIGKGDTDTGDGPSEQLLGDHEFFGNSEHRFALTAPSAPLSYNGKLIKVQWQVKVRLDRPFAFDVNEETDIRIV